jgi:hypothetical protein
VALVTCSTVPAWCLPFSSPNAFSSLANFCFVVGRWRQVAATAKREAGGWWSGVRGGGGARSQNVAREG